MRRGRLPVPQVTWLKNNLRLPSSNRINVEQDNTLVITGATPIGKLASAIVCYVAIGNKHLCKLTPDGGIYTCLAKNKVEMRDAVVRLTVEAGEVTAQCKDHPKKANCALIVRGRYCNRGKYDELCCKSCVDAGLIVAP